MKKESMLLMYLREMRIKSWLKNLFVLCPVIFSLELFERSCLARAILLTLAFCMVSSGIYIFNDISDVENDRKHEVKKHRPIAAGKISVSAGFVLMMVLAIAGHAMALAVNRRSFFLILVYVAMNILYSKWLKGIPLVDCFCIATGFLLRVMVGGTIVSSGVSDWMFLTVLSLSLFLAFGKRRGEVGKYADGQTRDVLGAYDRNFLDGVIFMCAGLTMVFYSLWSISQKSDLMYSVPIVLFIVLRYLLLVFRGKEEADPTNLILSDKILLVSCGLWALVILAMLYLA